MPDSSTWINHMRKGFFDKAWEFRYSILKAGLNRDYLNLPRHFKCIWDGTPLSGKRVLIRCYHGLGDTIMFILYARLVKEIAIIESGTHLDLMHRSSSHYKSLVDHLTSGLAAS